MTEQTKAILGCIIFIVYMAILSLVLEYFFRREARRQFYKDLLRLIILYDNNPPDVFNREMPKILGVRISRYSTYEKVMQDIFLVHNSGLSGCQTALAYALSLHQSYCVSTRELKKYKIKLLKEKTK